MNDLLTFWQQIIQNLKYIHIEHVNMISYYTRFSVFINKCVWCKNEKNI